MDGGGQKVRILCREKLAALCTEPGLYWLIGSPLFLPPLTIVSVLRCLHSSPANVYSPDYSRESDELKTLLPRGFDVVGAFIVFDANWEGNARKAIDASLRMKQLLRFDEVGHDIIGAAGDSVSVDIHFFVSESRIPSSLKAVTVVKYEDNPEKYVWENGCLLRCQLDFKLPVYVSMNGKSDVERITSETDSAIRNLRDPKVVFIVEGTGSLQHPVFLRGSELCQISDLSGQEPEESTAQTSGKNKLPCSHFLKSKDFNSFMGLENADTIRVTIFSSQSGSVTSSCAPVAEYFPASEPVKLLVANFNVDILCYASKDFGVSSAVSRLVIPAVADQIARLSDAITLNISSQEPRLHPHHFFPPGILHPITAIYNLRIRESEIIQVNLRRSLHLRVGLPLDRPLLLIANSLSFNKNRTVADRAHRSGVIKDIHTDIPRSCVSGGLASLVEGSYEYYHYLQDGFDDSGWGCAYRSLQTIISWFRIHQYTSIEVPSHRDIQQALVDIGDKEPYFVGSREWIGAIELSFVLDKLLGVSCKIINVRSGAELPEKCRELALHFETQGTPVMIGGGVLAYTLLGVDYNEVSGDCAFLILDPHYTGSDDRKKIIVGGWCCWKKPVDSKGKKFFLDDKFYNLLLPQRPNMV